MLLFGVFGIDSDGLNLAVNLLILCLVVDLAGARLLDVRRRPPAHGGPDAGRLRDRRVALPVRRLVVYMIVRPPEYLDDVRERELEMQAAEAAWLSSATCSARTATPRSSATSSAAPTACAA